jgi:His-Xaa-Ser system protein HxsD
MPKKQSIPFVVTDEGTVHFEVDLSVYSLDTVKRAAIKFTSECAVLFERESESLLIVILNFAGDQAKERKLQLGAALCNEILDQDLRESIAQKTEGSRNLILAHAFSKTSLTSNQ